MFKLRSPMAIIPAFVLAFALAVAGAVAEEAKAGKVAIGDKVPDFKLTDTEGKEHSLEQYKGKIVALDFCSQMCPVSRGADPQISALAKEMKEKGVVFLGIDSHKDTKPEQIQGYMKETGIPFPIVKDWGNHYADTMNAMVTPEIYVVDKKGNLAYHGKFDNRKDPTSEATVHYVKDALVALLEGKPVEVTEVKAVGCAIKRADS